MEKELNRLTVSGFFSKMRKSGGLADSQVQKPIRVLDKKWEGKEGVGKVCAAETRLS